MAPVDCTRRLPGNAEVLHVKNRRRLKNLKGYWWECHIVFPSMSLEKVVYVPQATVQRHLRKTGQNPTYTISKLGAKMKNVPGFKPGQVVRFVTFQGFSPTMLPIECF